MQIKIGRKTYTVGAYDVIQILIRGQWMDYSSIRDESDARTAIGMVIRHPGVYRIVNPATNQPLVS